MKPATSPVVLWLHLACADLTQVPSQIASSDVRWWCVGGATWFYLTGSAA